MSLASRIGAFVSAVAADIKSLRDGKADDDHNHAIGDITSLQAAIDTIPTNVTSSGVKLFDGAVQRSQIVMIDGDTWLLANAYWDTTALEFYRVDKTKAAFGMVLQGNNNIPGEEELGFVISGIIQWVASPAAYDLIRGGGTGGGARYAAVGGWELGSVTASQKFVTIGGNGIEIDGHGSSPYGRVQHYESSGVRRTGIMTNAYLDESERDIPADSSWWAGFREADNGDETFRVQYAPGNVALAWNDVLVIEADGTVTFKTGTDLVGVGKINGSLINSTLVGLSNVNNTADADKPVSGPTAAALDYKANADGSGAYGNWNINILGTANKIGFPDTRAVVSVPDEIAGYQVSYEFKAVASVGTPPIQSGGGYAWIQNIHGWGSDGSGGWPIQLSWSGEGLAIRQGDTATTWKPWKTFAMVPTDGVQPLQELLVYYGFPIAYNGIWDTAGVIAAISQFKYWVVGDEYQDPLHEEYASTSTIIAGVRAAGVKVYGYVPIGLNTSGKTQAQMKTMVDQWVVLSVDGIFLDEFGFDYGNSRARQVEITDYVHTKGVPYCANAWTVHDFACDNVSELTWATDDWRYINFTTGNPSNTVLTRSPGDCYMLENFCYSNDGPGNVFDNQERFEVVGAMAAAKDFPVWALAVFAENAGGTALKTTKLGNLKTLPELGAFITANAYLFNFSIVGSGGFSFGSAGVTQRAPLYNLPESAKLPTIATVGNYSTKYFYRYFGDVKVEVYNVTNNHRVFVTATVDTTLPVATPAVVDTGGSGAPQLPMGVRKSFPRTEVKHGLKTLTQSDWTVAGDGGVDLEDIIYGPANTVATRTLSAQAGILLEFDPINITSKALRFLVKCSSWSQTLQVSIVFSATSSVFTNTYTLDLKARLQNPPDAEWIEFLVPVDSLTVDGTPDPSAIINAIVLLKDTGVALVTFKLGTIDIVSKSTKSMVSITLDDGLLSCVPGLNSMLLRRIPGSVYIVPRVLGTIVGDDEFMTQETVDRLDVAGWDIGGHEWGNLTLLDATTMSTYVKDVAIYLSSRGYSGGNVFAYPNGAYDYDTISEVRKYFDVALNIDGVPQPTEYISPYRVNRVSIDKYTTLAQVKTWVTNSIADKSWLILNFHSFSDTLINDPDWKIADFNSLLDWLLLQDTSLTTVSESLNLLSASRAPTSGSGVNFIVSPTEPIDPELNQLWIKTT